MVVKSRGPAARRSAAAMTRCRYQNPITPQSHKQRDSSNQFRLSTQLMLILSDVYPLLRLPLPGQCLSLLLKLIFLFTGSLLGFICRPLAAGCWRATLRLSTKVIYLSSARRRGMKVLWCLLQPFVCLFTSVQREKQFVTTSLLIILSLTMFDNISTN